MQHMQKTTSQKCRSQLPPLPKNRGQYQQRQKPTNKERQKYQRRGGRNNSTTTRRGTGRRINRPRTNNVYNRTHGRLEKDQSDRTRIQRN